MSYATSLLKSVIPTKDEDKTFKETHPLEERKKESERIRRKFPDRIPLIAEVDRKCKAENVYLEKHKYLVPAELTYGQLQYIIRKKMPKLRPEQAIFGFVNGVLPPTSDVLSTLYQRHKDEDGFMYVTYATENTFG